MPCAHPQRIALIQNLWLQTSRSRLWQSLPALSTAVLSNGGWAVLEERWVVPAQACESWPIRAKWTFWKTEDEYRCCSNGQYKENKDTQKVWTLKMSILQCETFQLVIWWKSCVLDIIATLTPASYCLQLWHNSGRMSRVLQSVSGVLCIWDTTCRAQYILFLGSFVAVSALSRSSNQNLDFFTWHVGFFVFFFYLARSIIVRVCVLREISIFYSLNFNILNLANCQTHRKICHDIASVIIMKKPCYEPDYRECVKASNTEWCL